MNNENEIEIMLKIANEATADCKVCADCKFRINGDCCNRKVGEYLQNAGIGDKKQAVKEFGDMVVDTLDNYQYDDMTVREIVDNLITELYGADK